MIFSNLARNIVTNGRLTSFPSTTGTLIGRESIRVCGKSPYSFLEGVLKFAPVTDDRNRIKRQYEGVERSGREERGRTLGRWSVSLLAYAAKATLSRPADRSPMPPGTAPVPAALAPAFDANLPPIEEMLAHDKLRKSGSDSC
jgi:hypothetical protein